MSCMKRTSVRIKNIWITQICTQKVWDLATAFRVRKRFETSEKRAPGQSYYVVNCLLDQNTTLTVSLHTGFKWVLTSYMPRGALCAGEIKILLRESLEILCQWPSPRRSMETVDLNFLPYTGTGMFWHVTWLIQGHMTNGLPPHSLEKDAVTASKACVRQNINSTSVFFFNYH